MGSNSKIEWTDHSFNPWRGCTHALQADGSTHSACEHCYAEAMAKRFPDRLGTWGAEGTRVVASEAYWKLPLKWNRQAACIQTFDCANGDHADCCPQKHRPRVFCASLADVFEDWQGLMRGSKGGVLHRGEAWSSHKPFVEVNDVYVGRSVARMGDVRQRLFELIDATPNLDWSLLTKRPENVRRMWIPHGVPSGQPSFPSDRFRKNVWIGTSISDQATADEWIPKLLECRDLAPVLFLSIEPLLGPIKLQPYMDASGEVRISQGVDCDWVIVGGESGPHARPMHPQWARGIRDQCSAAGTPFFFKQWGEWAPNEVAAANPGWAACGPDRVHVFPDRDEVALRIGKKLAGRTLDGEEWSEFPSVPSAPSVV